MPHLSLVPPLPPSESLEGATVDADGQLALPIDDSPSSSFDPAQMLAEDWWHRDDWRSRLEALRRRRRFTVVRGDVA